MTEESRLREVAIVETDQVELKNPLVIMGFAGVGLVGGIATTHIIEQLKMRKIAHVRSRYIPPSVVFLEGQLRHPFRIYSDEEGDVCAIICEVPLPAQSSYPIASALLDWIEERGVKELVVFEGIPVRGIPKERKPFCAAEPDKRRECEEKGVMMTSRGVIYGIVGSILNECLTRKITGLALLTPAVTFMPDPEGAVILIDALNRIHNLEISTQELADKGDKIKQTLKEIAERHKRMRINEEKRGVSERIYA
jgi:uncharacterized protein